MARIRTVKPEYFTHPEILELTRDSRYLLISLFTQADDEGRLRDQPFLIRCHAFGEDDDVDIHALLEELSDEKRIDRYSAVGHRYIEILNFNVHQVISKPTPSKLPANPQGNPGNPAVEQGREQGSGSGKEETFSSPALQDDTSFEMFWKLYPRRNGKRLHKNKALSAWRRLNKSQREPARNGAVHYAAACNSGVTIAKDAFRWLRDHEFEDWQTPAEGSRVAPEERGASFVDVHTWKPEELCAHGMPPIAACDECLAERRTA